LLVDLQYLVATAHPSQGRTRHPVKMLRIASARRRFLAMMHTLDVFDA